MKRDIPRDLAAAAEAKPAPTVQALGNALQNADGLVQEAADVVSALAYAQRLMLADPWLRARPCVLEKHVGVLAQLMEDKVAHQVSDLINTEAEGLGCAWREDRQMAQRGGSHGAAAR